MSTPPVIPTLTVGCDVLIRVERLFSITGQKAEVVVIAIILPTGESIPLVHPIRGAIRHQDARSFDIDKATISNHFQPGDIVKATTLSVGDAKSCFFSTCGPDYGVIMAKDPLTPGAFLVPIDESHMRNSDNSVVYKRKVARPVWLPATSPVLANGTTSNSN